MVEIGRFDYALPDSAIAQTPVEPRDAARLLDATGASGGIQHRRVCDLPSLVCPGDVLVVNDTRVRPARLRLRKPTGGAVEVLLLEEGPEGWEALVHPGRRVPPGTTLEVGPDFRVVIGDRLPGGARRVRLETTGSVDDALFAYGEVPLPPYIREGNTDPGRYQTVYARRPVSTAAPTAGLHLTTEVLAACAGSGAGVASVELHIGLDTFRPIATERVEDHTMHSEAYAVPRETWDAVQRADRVIAVGTTVVRALEAAASTGELEGRTDLFIQSSFRFEIVDRLLTNFHMPRSSLLVLLEAFCGPRWRALYDVALRDGYRFLSFGDCMLVDRAHDA
jgi:S-adenosylmethionine:tRNA ribosyltransferase-isomerase